MSGQKLLINDCRRNTLGYATGIGIDYAMSDRLFIGAEARYQSALKRTFALTPQGQADHRTSTAWKRP